MKAQAKWFFQNEADRKAVAWKKEEEYQQKWQAVVTYMQEWEDDEQDHRDQLSMQIEEKSFTCRMNHENHLKNNIEKLWQQNTSAQMKAA